MLEYNSNILKSDSRLLYVDNIQNIKNITKTLLKPNDIIVSSYNYNVAKNYRNYSGTSYELYYVSNNSYLHQLTYYVNEGNGLYINDKYNIKLNYDNKTIKENANHELYIDSSELTCAYNNIYKGILSGENKLFYDHLINNSGFIISSNGTLKITNGLLMSLYEIKNYYDKFDIMALDINKLAVKLDYSVDLFNIGEILYVDKNGKYTKVAEGNMPFMVCVIASNTLSDNCARFVPFKYNNSNDIFARNNDNIYYKRLYNSIPIYEDDLNFLTSSSNITTSDFGYIATDNPNWQDNFKNPFNYKERYYANFYTIKSNIIWYMDPDSFHDQDMYSIEKKAIVTEIINLNKFNESEVCPIIKITFSDGFKGYYLLNLNYSKDNSRFELVEGSITTKNEILLLSKLNEVVENSTNISSTNDDKIKTYKSDVIVNSSDLVNKYKLYLVESTDENSIRFENENMNNIDYKILVDQLKHNVETITTTKTETKSRVVQDEVTNTTVTYNEVLEDIDENDLYEMVNVLDENGNEAVTWQKRERQKTLVPVYNTTTEYVDRTEYYDEVITEYTYVTHYTYKLIMSPGICDRNKAYLKVQLGDSAEDLSDWFYFEYDNNTGLEYVFTKENTKWNSTSSKGYIKILAYASSEYYDMNPIDLGIIAVNGYQDSFKCINLTKDRNSFSFNLSSIIPVKAEVIKNYTILTLNDEANILESNGYDDFLDAYDYTLDLNYSSTITVEDYVQPILSETTEEVTNGTPTKEIIETTQSPKEVIPANNNVKSETTNSTNNLIKKDNTSQEEVKVDNTKEVSIKTTDIKPRLIPGAIIIPFKNYNNINEFVNNIYYVTVEIRNNLGKPTFNRFKFKKDGKKLVLAEQIPVLSIYDINRVRIVSIEDNSKNTLPIKFRPYGKLVNQIKDWSDLRVIK